MFKNIKKINPDEKELETKQELKNLGAQLAEHSANPQRKLEAELSDLYNSVPENKKSRLKSFFGKRLVVYPVLGLVVIIFSVVMIKITDTKEVYDYAYSGDSYDYSNPITTDEGFQFIQTCGITGCGSAGLGSNKTTLLQKTATFKDKFLGALGYHEASPEAIAERGPILEQALNVSILTTEKTTETRKTVEHVFEDYGGYVIKITPSIYMINAYGKIPADRIDDLKNYLKDYAGKDKYYQENLSANSRTADVIAIEEKIKEVEDSIEYLKNAIAGETDPAKKQTLQKQLEETRAYLGEREETKENIMDRVEYVDVNINITSIPSFWKASRMSEIQKLYSGFNQISMWDKLIINVLHVIIIFLRILSYTFWIIPIVIWIIILRRRDKKLLEEME